MCEVGLQSSGNAEENDKELHFTFVELLFSLAVAEIALRFADVVDYAGGDFWRAVYSPCYFHLTLALFVITTSWIGWGKSTSSHRNTRFSSVFKLDFAELLIDVFLVIVYFVLVHLSELPDSNGDVLPSIGPEAICIVAIFVLYFLWDVVSKWPTRVDVDGKQIGWGPLRRRGRISLLTMILAAAASSWCWWWAAASAVQVAVFDVGLIGLVVMFRELKEAATENPRGRGWWRVVASVAIFLVVFAVPAFQ